VRELARLADVQLNAIRREISNLARVGLIAPADVKDSAKDADVGTVRSKYFKLNGGCLLFFELKALLLKALILREQEFVELMKEKAGKLKLLLLTGNFSGEPEGETDVLLVGEIKPMVISRIISEFEKKTGKSVRYTLMNEEEFRERMEIGDKFLYGIFEGKHVKVVDDIIADLK